MTFGAWPGRGAFLLCLTVLSVSDVVAADPSASSSPEVEELRFAGVVEPAHRVAVSNEIDGVVRRIHFAGGEDVDAGRLLFELDDTAFRIALRLARAQLAQQRARLEQATAIAARQKKLFDRGVSPEARNIDAGFEAAAAGAAVQEAEAAVALAELNLARTRITAPIAGRIGRPLVSQGAFVEAEATERPLVEIVQVDPIFVAYTVPYDVRLQSLERAKAENLQDLLTRIKVRLLLPTGRPYPQAGVPQLTTFQVDATTGELTTWASFENGEGLLVPGLKVQVLSRIEAPAAAEGGE